MQDDYTGHIVWIVNASSAIAPEFDSASTKKNERHVTTTLHSYSYTISDIQSTRRIIIIKIKKTSTTCSCSYIYLQTLEIWTICVRVCVWEFRWRRETKSKKITTNLAVVSFHLISASC